MQCECRRRPTELTAYSYKDLPADSLLESSAQTAQVVAAILGIICLTVSIAILAKFYGSKDRRNFNATA